MADDAVRTRSDGLRVWRDWFCEHFGGHAQTLPRGQLRAALLEEAPREAQGQAGVPEAEWTQLLSNAVAGAAREQAAGPDAPPTVALKAAGVECTVHLMWVAMAAARDGAPFCTERRNHGGGAKEGRAAHDACEFERGFDGKLGDQGHPESPWQWQAGANNKHGTTELPSQDWRVAAKQLQSSMLLFSWKSGRQPHAVARARESNMAEKAGACHEVELRARAQRCGGALGDGSWLIGTVLQT